MAAHMMRSFGIALGVIAVIGIAGVGGYYAMTHLTEQEPAMVPETETVSEEETRATEVRSATVNGYSVADYSQSEMVSKLEEETPWSLTVTKDGQNFETENYLEGAITRTVEEAYNDLTPGTYTVEMTEDEINAAADSISANAAEQFNDPEAESGGMTYDEENDKFVVQESEARMVVDAQTLHDSVVSALENGQYDAVIEVPMKEEPATGSAEDYKIIGSFQTTTTKNENRNTNVSLACKSVNGTVLKPGESFSYNDCLGPRTAEKGYKEAGAYANGEHVLEYGGGICQVSSTIYNALIAAGIQVDERTGHTYEPSYVTPGNDAAVSYPNPNFVFTNNTGADLGVYAHFADRTITIELYGIPILEDGVTCYLKSEKTGDIAAPEPTYVEDLTVVPGMEVMVSEGKPGSSWTTNIVLEKDGEVISDEYLHTTRYRGTAPEIHRNTSGVYVDPATLLQQQQAAAAAAAAGTTEAAQ